MSESAQKKKNRRIPAAQPRNKAQGKNPSGVDRGEANSPELTLTITAYLKNQLPELENPQIALAGRSNVGKSSLINCMASRKSLAKISSTPGKTRSVNFYRVGAEEPDALYLVDLPGYGYARCSKAEREKWERLIQHYLTNTPTLRAVAVLLDSRLEPQAIDLTLTSYIRDLGLTIVPVLTKADKCKQRERAAKQKEWQAILAGEKPILFSSRTGMGRSQLWQRLLALR